MERKLRLGDHGLGLGPYASRSTFPPTSSGASFPKKAIANGHLCGAPTEKFRTPLGREVDDSPVCSLLLRQRYFE
jgi:hypothetical protein